MAVTIPDPIKADCERKGGVQGIKKLLPSSKVLEKKSQVFQALSDPIRLKILLALSEQPLCVCLIKEIVKISDSKLSYHLGVLKDAKLIIGKKQGSWIIYYPTENGLKFANIVRKK